MELMRHGIGSFSRLREKAGDEGAQPLADPHPNLSLPFSYELRTSSS